MLAAAKVLPAAKKDNIGKSLTRAYEIICNMHIGLVSAMGFKHSCRTVGVQRQPIDKSIWADVNEADSALKLNSFLIGYEVLRSSILLKCSRHFTATHFYCKTNVAVVDKLTPLYYCQRSYVGLFTEIEKYKSQIKVSYNRE